MKKTDLEIGLIRLEFWPIESHRHDCWRNWDGFMIPVPPHREINDYTAEGILRRACAIAWRKDANEI